MLDACAHWGPIRASRIWLREQQGQLASWMQPLANSWFMGMYKGRINKNRGWKTPLGLLWF